MTSTRQPGLACRILIQEWVRELAKDKATDVANGLLSLSGDSPLMMMGLVQQNLDLYKEATKGNWDPYVKKFTEAIIGAIAERFDIGGPAVDAIISESGVGQGLTSIG